MRLRSGRGANGSDSESSSHERDMEELSAQLQSLRNENAMLQAQVAALAARSEPGSSTVSRGRPSVQVQEPLEDVPTLAELGDIQHQGLNPVRRSARAPDFTSLIDVEGEPGYIRACNAGAAVAKEYADIVAPLLSYRYDSQLALEQQVRASDIPEARRKSLAVVVAALRAELEFITERHDLLVLKGVLKNDPSRVQALEQGLAGVEGLPVSSGRVQQMLEKASVARVLALSKQSAKQAVGPNRSSGGSGNPSA